MKLFLAAEAKHPTSLAQVQQFVQGFEGKKIAYIPTAANGYFYGSWKNSGSVQTVQSFGAQVNIIQLEDYLYRNVLLEVSQADILWVTGGLSGYLLYWMRRVKLDTTIHKWLDNGMIYIGSSAGSMACSKTQQVNDIYITEQEPGASIIPGLGLIDFEIYPHYEDQYYKQIYQSWSTGKLCLLKNGEAVIVDNGSVQIFGEERWIQK